MLKRAALARAIALDPELLFLDEPTSGLDPASAAGVDELILRTHALFGPTIVIVTHDLDLLWQVCDRVAVLGEGHVLALGTMAGAVAHTHPIVSAYFADRAQRTRRASLTTEHEPWTTRSTTAWWAPSCWCWAPRWWMGCCGWRPGWAASRPWTATRR
jgi:phospholipid/cholesterol/gamma-HCH transport system ATP-binding protein